MSFWKDGYEFEGGGSGSKKNSIFYQLSKIPLPVESFGACSNAKNCRNWEVVLGNGYCVKCWDKGLGSGRKRFEEEEGTEAVREAQEERYKFSGGYRKPYVTSATNNRTELKDGQRTYSID